MEKQSKQEKLLFWGTVTVFIILGIVVVYLFVKNVFLDPESTGRPETYSCIFALLCTAVLLIIVIICMRKRNYKAIRDLCGPIALGAMVFVLLGVFADTLNSDTTSVPLLCLMYFCKVLAPMGAVLSAFCGGILGYLPDDPAGKDAPADKKEEVKK